MTDYPPLHRHSIKHHGNEDNANRKLRLKQLRSYVHLDLKGGPPKPSYLKYFFKILAKWGIAGVIVEWEDCFPYKGDLEHLSNNLYSPDDAVQIIQDILEANLELIPLVQTFGHLEFVLKHSNHVVLREVPLYPSSICPSHPQALPLIISMLDQVISLHGGIKHFHIGADEVWHMGFCERCKARMEAGESKEDIFLKYVKSLVENIKSKWPDLTIIMWDDMLREMDQTIILAYNLTSLIEPMVWHYTPAETFSLPADIWRKYSCFPEIWVAGAFKGASGGSQLVPPIAHHASNVLQWSRCLNLLETPCRGFVFTGWSRYDHFAALCEILPTSLSSLGVCIRVLEEENFTPEVISSVEQELRLSELTQLGKSADAEDKMLFSSGQILILATRLISLRQSTQAILTCDQLQTWMNDWQVAQNRVNPMQLVTLIPILNNMVEEYNNLEKAFKVNMLPIFYPTTINEWIGTYIRILRTRLQTTLNTAEQIVAESTKIAEDAAKICEMDY